MNIWEFYHHHVFLGFLSICAVYYVLKMIFLQIPVRIIRHFTIRKAGWPPAHLDADGDFKKAEIKK